MLNKVLKSPLLEVMCISALLALLGVSLIVEFEFLLLLTSAYLIYRLYSIQKTDHLMTALINQAETDPLTGVYNRTGLETQYNTNRRLGNSVALMIDIDYFKSINDQHGHAIGDRVLKEFAKLLESLCRTDDVVARWGGEEFVIIFKNVGFGQGAGLAEKVRKAIETNKFCIGHITASIGYAESQIVSDAKHNMPLNGLLQFADHALYEAKNAGRNRVSGQYVELYLNRLM